MLFTLFTIQSCSSPDSYSDDGEGEDLKSEYIVSQEGGIFTFSNGVKMTVPEGALQNSATIKVTNLDSDEIPEVFAGNEIIESVLIGGFAGEPDGLVFQKPITVTVPYEFNQWKDTAFYQISVDIANQSIGFLASDVSFDSESSTVSMTVDHFSGGGVTAIKKSIGDESTSMESNFVLTEDWDTCEEYPSKEVTPTKNKNDDCKCGKRIAKTKFVLYSNAGGCQSIQSVVRMNFPDCTPTLYINDILSKESSQCDMNFSCKQADNSGVAICTEPVPFYCHPTYSSTDHCKSVFKTELCLLKIASKPKRAIFL